jgi:hypothetical protein
MDIIPLFQKKSRHYRDFFMSDPEKSRAKKRRRSEIPPYSAGSEPILTNAAFSGIIEKNLSENFIFYQK